MQQPPQIIGLLCPRNPDAYKDSDWLRTLWQDTLASGYNFILLPVSKILPVSDTALTLAEYDALPEHPFTRKAHSALSSKEWPSVTAVISNHAGCRPERDVQVRILEEGAQWAKYLGMRSLMLDLDWLLGNSLDDVEFIAGSLRQVLEATSYEGLHLSVRMCFSTRDWQRWNTLRNAIGPAAKNRLHVVLDVGSLTAAPKWDQSLKRWFGESIQSLSIPTPLFVLGSHGQPMLPMQVSAILDRFFDYPGIAWFIDGPELHGQGYTAYREFMTKLESIHEVSELEQFLRPSTDHLQRPMQPLHDQLHSSAYELFEKDPVKYVQYEKAIAQALADRHAQNQPAVVMVLGAGRGPLVDCVIGASKTTNIPVTIYVIEKNPTAVVTLRHRAVDDWRGMDVKVVATDMRDWNAPEQADIIVSELLGSWGDNELSPECLDGANHLLKDTGISIPEAYTSWLAPISSARLHAKVASLAPARYPQVSSRGDLESQYVVKMGAVFALAEEQPCFSFSHPNRERASNERFTSLVFTLPDELEEVIVHGFRGTFDCTLYGEHGISIAKRNYSAGMFCWFPLFIPLQTPLTLAGGDKLELLVWRKVDSTRVWYEWQVKNHTPVTNPDGRSGAIELF